MQRSQFSEKAEREKWGGVQYRLKFGILLFTIILTIADCSGSIRLMDLAAEKSAAGVVGGPCEYKQYKGKASITSIRKKEMPENYAGPSYESYEVKFSFFSEEEIKEAYGKVKGREYILMLTNSWYPGPKFLKKYGIKIGKSFECYLTVIVKGTCTPVLFDFPTIDLGDYFEHKR